jgi:3-oxoadipate enol-lactonase
MAHWLFAPATYNERPEFIEALLVAALANPYPQSVTGFLRQVEAVEGHDTRERLGAIRCPTLVSVGEEDALVPLRFARELAGGIPGATLRAVPGCGHAYFWERADEFNRLTLDFLAGA